MSPEREPSRPAPDPRLLGAVLCGGASRRMGSDKARLEVGGRSLIQVAVDALEPVCGRVVLACGERERYGELGHELVLDGLPAAGPLAGLVAVLARGDADGHEVVIAFACDLPGIDPSVARALVERLDATGADLCMLTSAGGDEPLLAAYSVRCAAPAANALAAGERRLVSFQDGLAIARVDAGELGDPDCVRNVNTPDDLALARGGGA